MWKHSAGPNLHKLTPIALRRRERLRGGRIAGRWAFIDEKAERCKKEPEEAALRQKRFDLPITALAWAVESALQKNALQLIPGHILSMRAKSARNIEQGSILRAKAQRRLMSSTRLQATKLHFLREIIEFQESLHGLEISPTSTFHNPFELHSLAVIKMCSSSLHGVSGECALSQ